LLSELITSQHEERVSEHIRDDPRVEEILR
jgi:hypothetical protein